jgi:hypothetical protein
MKENLDPHQITISREMFDDLVAVAEHNRVYARSEVHPNRTLAAKARWHARKFNPAYKAEQAKLRKEEADRYKWQRQTAIDFLRQWEGKEIQVNHFNGVCETYMVVGRSPKSKLHIRLRLTYPDKKFVAYFNVSAWAFIEGGGNRFHLDRKVFLTT